MGNIHLVTGYAGQEHVTAADHGAFNAALFGTGQFVFSKGNQLSASIVTNNLIRVLDGDIFMQGRHIRLNEDTYVDLTIENGSQEMLRHDLIVARYTKSNVTGVEDVNLVVIKGTAVASSASPSDPAYTEGDIISGHALQNDMPLYRVVLNGLNVQSLVPLFTVNEITMEDIKNKQDKTNRLTAATEIDDADSFPFFDASVSAHKKATMAVIKSALGKVFSALGHTHDDRYFTETETLKNATKGMFGLTSEAVPDDVFALIGPYSQHWWWRKSIASLTKYRELKTDIPRDTYFKTNDGSVMCSDAISLNEDTGEISLVSPTVVTSVADIKGHYVQGQITTGYDTSYETIDTTGIYYVGSNPKASTTGVGYVAYQDEVYLVTAEAYSVDVGEVSYVHSVDRNAYPDTGDQNGFEYLYLGNPINNAVTGPKVATGSYTGTGAGGSNSPNSLTFDFAPKFVIVMPSVATVSSSPCYGVMLFPDLGFGITDERDDYSYSIVVTVSGKTVNWYSSDNMTASRYQANLATTYHYFAIG